MRGADAIRVGVSATHRHGRPYNLWRRVPPFVMRWPIVFDKRVEVDLPVEFVGHRGPVWPEAVRRKLEPAVRRVVQLPREGPRVLWAALAEMPSDHQFRVALNGREAVRITKGLRAIEAQASLLLHPDKTPH